MNVVVLNNLVAQRDVSLYIRTFLSLLEPQGFFPNSPLRSIDHDDVNPHRYVIERAPPVDEVRFI